MSELKVQERAPRCLDAAYREALNLEMWQQSVKGRSASGQTQLSDQTRRSSTTKKRKLYEKCETQKRSRVSTKLNSLVMKRIAELEKKIVETAPIQAFPLLRGATVRALRPSLQPRIPFQFTRLMQSYGGKVLRCSGGSGFLAQVPLSVLSPPCGSASAPLQLLRLHSNNVTGARCVQKRIMHTTGVFSIV